MPQSPIYEPPPGLHTNMDELRAFISQELKVTLGTYHDLHDFSVKHANDFWTCLWRFLDVQASETAPKAIDETLRIDQFPQFFDGAKLNFAENILRTRGSSTAVLSMDESSLHAPERVSWDDLRDRVQQTADAMTSSELHSQDVVVVIGNNSVETLVLLLATAALGAVFCSFATDLGEKALRDRLTQLQPRLVFAQTMYSYNGKHHNISKRIFRIFSNTKALSGAELVLPDAQCSNGVSNARLRPSATRWSDFLCRGKGRRLEFLQVPFNAPVVIMFSSGTTGTPKGIVHSHGGLVINGWKEHLLHNNFGPRDTYFHYTNIGWTLWNIMIGALFCGTTIVLYDGSPFYPEPTAFLREIFAAGVTAFGAGPRYFEELRNARVNPKPFTQNLDLISSTGAALTSSLSSWIADAFGPVCQISMSGGTELCGSFVHGTRSLPGWPGEITVKALGLDIDVLSLDGAQVPLGQMGELVCKRAFPNMPVRFLHDGERRRYFDAYFSKIPHVWTHGDLIKVEPKTGGLTILGRSDGVLNPSGVRFGSSEIYSVLAIHFAASIDDSICVGRQRLGRDSHERVFLFVKLSQRCKGRLWPRLERAIRQKIAQDLSRRHVPEFIFEVNSIPYNVNGKKMEVQAKAVINGGQGVLLDMKLPESGRAALEPFIQYFHVENTMGTPEPQDVFKGDSKL